jgi:hypothetical protein
MASHGSFTCLDGSLNPACTSIPLEIHSISWVLVAHAYYSQEAEIRRIAVQSQLGQIVHEILSPLVEWLKV